MRTIAIANSKGGVGKTSVTLALGSALHRAGQRVLVIDMDPQASATKALEPEEGTMPPTIRDVLLPDGGVELAATIRSTTWGFDLAPADRYLTKFDLVSEAGREFRLREVLEGVDGYDFVLLDCPPNTGVLTLTAMVAADSYLAVTEPSLFALAGLMDLETEIVAPVRRRLNKGLTRVGVLVTLVQRTMPHNDAIAELREAFGDELLQPMIPRLTAMQKAIDRGLPLGELGAVSGAIKLQSMFDQLAQEVMGRVLTTH